MNEELNRSNGHHPTNNNGSPPANGTNGNGHTTNANGNGHATSNGNGNGHTNGQRQATQSQIKAIYGIARNQRIDVGQLMERYGVRKPDELDLKTASKVIDSLKSNAGEGGQT